jgi:hypothetical protein
MVKSKPIDANDDSPEAKAKRAVAKLMPRMYLYVFLGMFGFGAAGAAFLLVLAALLHLFTK